MTIVRSIVLATALVGLVACQKEEAAPQQVAAPVVLTAPTDGNSQAWKLYLTNVVKQNMEGIRNSPYMYYLPAAGDEDFESQYERQLDNVGTTVARGVLPGNMLAFGSPESARMADLIVEAFQEAQAGSLDKVRVLFIGNPEDEERVRAAVEPAGATFVFVDATK